MAYTRSSNRTTHNNGIAGPRTTQTSRVKPSLMARLTGRRKVETTTVTRESHTVPKHGHHHTNHRTGAASTTTTGTAHHHHKRHATMGDKISGAMLKMKGSLTHRPGEKAAGTRRMHGTDGRGSRRVY